MEILNYVLGGILLVAAIFLIVAVLMQEGKSKGMGAVGGSSSDSFYGKTKGKTWDKTLSKLTTICGIVFVVIVLVVYIIQKDINSDDYFNENIGGGETTAVETTGSLFGIMFTTLKQLFTGVVGVKDLSGPVGIYTVVSDQAKNGFESLMYLTAYLSVNVGVINLLPFPALDGGRACMTLYELVTTKKIPSKIEYAVNALGMLCLIVLMIFTVFNDIARLITP